MKFVKSALKSLGTYQRVCSDGKRAASFFLKGFMNKVLDTPEKKAIQGAHVAYCLRGIKKITRTNSR